MATDVVPATTPPMPKLILKSSQIINKITQASQIFFMYLILVLGGHIYTFLLYLAVVVVIWIMYAVGLRLIQIRWVMDGFMDTDNFCHPYCNRTNHIHYRSV